jgi:hypothetical protein
MLIFIVAAQVGEYIIFFLNDRFPGWHLATATVVADHSFPLLGGMTRFTFIYLIFIVLLYAGLYRFNIFPKDPFGAKARMQQQRDASQQATTPGAGSTRAARRHAARHATTSGSGSGKAPSARQVAAQAKAASPVRQAGGSDTEYERMKVAQRLRRRRDMKR